MESKGRGDRSGYGMELKEVDNFLLQQKHSKDTNEINHIRITYTQKYNPSRNKICGFYIVCAPKQVSLK